MLRLCFLLSSVLSADPVAQAWRQVYDKDGITVWDRAVAGSPLREVKAQAIIDVSAERMRDVIDDGDHYSEFMPYVRVHQRFGASARGHYEYERIEPPLIAARDYTVWVSIEDDARLRIYKRRWIEANDKAPVAPGAGVVRVVLNRGAWVIEALDASQSLLTYTLHTDPAGDLPTWIVNRANSDSLPDLIRSVGRRAKDPTYRR